MIFSNKNLNQLSQKDLTKLTFSRNLKNIIFFGGGVIIVLFLASLFGTVGIVIGWISIVIYGLFALEPLFAFLLTIPSILLPSSDRRWKFFQLFISGISTLLYLGFAFIIYSIIKKGSSPSRVGKSWCS